MLTVTIVFTRWLMTEQNGTAPTRAALPTKSSIDATVYTTPCPILLRASGYLTLMITTTTRLPSFHDKPKLIADRSKHPKTVWGALGKLPVPLRTHTEPKLISDLSVIDQNHSMLSNFLMS